MQARRPQRLPPEERRRQLLDAALVAVDEQGFGGVTVEAVARGAGVTRPVVYDLFGDLDGLLVALVEREEAATHATVSALLPQDPAGREPDGLLADGLTALLDAVRADPRRWRLILHAPAGAPRVLHERIAADRRRTVDGLAGLLAWGFAERGGPHGLDHEVLARMLIAAVEDAARLLLAHPRRFSPDRLAAAAQGILGLLPAPGRPAAA